MTTRINPAAKRPKKVAEWESYLKRYSHHGVVKYDYASLVGFIAHQRQQAVAEFAREVLAHAKARQYGVALLGTPLQTEELMAGIDNALDDVIEHTRYLAQKHGVTLD